MGRERPLIINQAYILDDATDLLFFRREAKTGGAVSLVDAHKAVADLVKLWVGRPDIGIAEAESALPQDMRDEIKANNAEDTTKGILHKGKIHIVAENIRSIEHFEPVVLRGKVAGIQFLICQKMKKIWAKKNRKVSTKRPKMRKYTGVDVYLP